MKRTAIAGRCSRVRWILGAAVLAIVSTALGAEDAAAPPERAPLTARPDSPARVVYAPFAKDWHFRPARAEMLGLWQRLVEVKVPGVAQDQRYRPAGPTFYVSPQGDDAGDGSPAHPWRTLAFAVKQLRPGVTIHLRAGTYYGPVVIDQVAGTADAPAALRGMDGEEAVITYPPDWIAARKAELGPPVPGLEGAPGKDGKPLHYPALITVNRSTCLEISGLRLVGARDQLPHNLYSENGIWFQHGASAGCRVLYCEVENVGHCGIKGGSGCLFEGNYIHDLGYSFHDHGFYQGGEDLIYRKNLIVNTAGFGIHGYTLPKRMLVAHNIVAGHAWYGVILGGSDSAVVHNLFLGSGRGGVFLFRDDCRNNLIAHNLFQEPGGAIGYDHDPAGNTVDYNGLLGGTKLGTARPGNTHGEHNRPMEPGFVDAAKLDFRLRPESPAVDAGNPGWGVYYGKAPDLGLYELGDGPVQGKPLDIVR